MINREKLDEVIVAYKKAFPKYWEEECYKWEAVQKFQNTWNIDAENFAEMFRTATSKTFNLLASQNYYPGKTIEVFAENDPDLTRQMFVKLFDESQDLVERIEQFKLDAEELREKCDDGSLRNHYQTENAITTYLWLRYPDKYYIYKYSECRAVANALESDFVPKKGGGSSNVVGCQELYDEIRVALKADDEMNNMFEESLFDDCYDDPELVTLMVDLGHYLNRYYKKDQTEQIDKDNTVVTGDHDQTKGSAKIYTKKDFLSQVFMNEEKYDTLAGLLKNKKNIILQGAPGVGKTFAAKRLAYSMMGEMDDSRIEFIQFHQNYSYEDFVMGYRPQEEGFKLTNGVFYQFCTKASNDPDRDYYFIIDEINRGNLSKIFGELLMAIENTYRGKSVTLAYNGMSFTVPENLYLIGMMNTADRSLALIDYALRRRFSFFDMEPGFNSDGFKAYLASLKNETFDELIERIKELNREIANDESLGEGFRIGHSYFCEQEDCSEEWMKSVVYYDIIPMLREYWFDDKQKLQKWENNLIGVFND